MHTFRPISRRGFNRGLLLSGLAALASPQFAAGARAEERITYFTWAGYDLPEFHQAYTQRYGSEPAYAYFPDSEEAFQKLRQGFAPEVAHPCLPHVQRWKEAGLLKPIDPSRLAHWESIIPTMRESPGVYFDDAHWTVPWEWGASSLIRRTDRVEALTETFSILLDPQYEGRVSVPDNTDEMSMLASLLAGVSDPYALTESDFRDVEEVMKQLVRQSRFLWSDPTTAEQAAASGEIVMFWGWPNSWNSLQTAGVPVAYMQNPAEGLISWTCGFALPAGSSGSEEEAYAFIDASLAPQSGKALIEKYGYGHSNLESFGLVDPKRLQALGMSGDVAAFLSNSNFLRARPEPQRQRLIELWNAAKFEAAQ